MVVGQFDDRCLRIDRYRVFRCGHRESWSRSLFSCRLSPLWEGQCRHADADRRRAGLGGERINRHQCASHRGKGDACRWHKRCDFAILIGGIASLWFDDPTIGGIIGLAMIVNLLLAGLAGTVIPLALDRWGVDPAVGSTVVLTTVTDVVGFLSFLGLAAMVFL